MPLLNDDELKHMRSIPSRKCRECKQETYQNYCRECDEFYSAGHLDSCKSGHSAESRNDHRGHRTY